MNDLAAWHAASHRADRYKGRRKRLPLRGLIPNTPKRMSGLDAGDLSAGAQGANGATHFHGRAISRTAAASNPHEHRSLVAGCFDRFGQQRVAIRSPFD
jgi:hypothetical protein